MWSIYKVSEYTFDKNHHWFLPETNFESVQRECFETATQKLSAQLEGCGWWEKASLTHFQEPFICPVFSKITSLHTKRKSFKNLVKVVDSTIFFSPKYPFFPELFSSFLATSPLKQIRKGTSSTFSFSYKEEHKWSKHAWIL